MSEKSIYDVIIDRLKQWGITPVPVQQIQSDSEGAFYFTGDLDEFKQALLALGAKAVYVEELYFDEEEFYYDSGVEDDERDDCDCCCSCKDDGDSECECAKEDEAEDGDDEIFPEDLDGLDLRLLDSEISKFDDRVGSVCGVRLVVPGTEHLELEVFEDWYDEFIDLTEAASEKIEEDPDEALKIIEQNSDLD